MNRYLVWAVIMLAVSFAGQSAPAAMILDSSAFSHQYNGDVYPVPNYSESGSWVTAPSTDGDILSFQSGIGSDPLFDSNQWAGAISDDTGWTLEIRLKIEDDAAEAEAGSLQMFLGDGDNTFGNSRMSVRIGKSAVRTNTDITLDTNANTDDYHTIRVAQEPNSNTFLFWRDGIALSSVADGSHAIASGFWWGDGSGAIGGPTIHVDYLRFDNTGAHAPVPEPSTFTMFSLVSLGFVSLAWLRQRVG